MKKAKLILQGGGMMSLVTPEDTPLHEVEGLHAAMTALMKERTPLSVFAGVDEIIDNRPLNEQALTKIVTRDRSSGKYHTRYIEVQIDGNERTLVDERCQADQSGSYDVLESVPESADRNTLCFNCFVAVSTPEELGHTAGPV